MRMSSCEPAVTRIDEKVYPVTPTFLLTAAFGSSGPRSFVTEPSASVELTVCDAPEIGSEPDTVAEGFTASSLMLEISPARASLFAAMLPAIVIILEVPAFTVNASPSVAWWFELKVLETPTCVPFSSRRITPENIASPAKVECSIVKLLTTTSLEPAVRVNLVNGTRAAFSGARPAAGCSVEDTTSPVPAGTVTTGDVPGVVPGVVIGVPPVIELTLARVAGPKYPTAGEIPCAA